MTCSDKIISITTDGPGQWTCDETDCIPVMMNVYNESECNGVPYAQGYYYVNQCFYLEASETMKYTCEYDQVTTLIYPNKDCSDTPTIVKKNIGNVTDGYCY